MNMREAEVELAKAIESIANPIVRDIGLLFHSEDERIFVAETIRCRALIILEWSTIVTMIKPLQGQSGEASQTEIQVDIGWVKTPEDIPAEIQRQMLYLVSQWEHLL